MMEISIADLFLIVWAVTATVLAYLERLQKRNLMYILSDILSNEESRKEAVTKWQRAHSR